MRLKELRETLGLTQKELGQKIGYSQRAISNWETGITQPNIENLKQLADIFGTSIDYLLNFSDEWDNQPLQLSNNSSYCLTDDELKILKYYRKLTPEYKEAILSSLEIFSHNCDK